jgi:hypothetical protein
MDSLSHTEGDNGQQQRNSSFEEYSQEFWRLLEVAAASNQPGSRRKENP